MPSGPAATNIDSVTRDGCPNGGTMFKTIVAGTDGREGGRDALSLAGRLARMSGADLVAVRVLPFDYYSTRAASPSFGEVADQDARAELTEELARAGVDARVRLQGDASPARALHRVAEDEHAGLIVVGSTHRGRAGRVLMGDHAAGTVHASPCPVAVAPRGFAGREWGAVTRIGVGFDGRPEARQALDLAIRLARDCGATIEVASVIGTPIAEVEPGVYDSEWLEQARADAEEELRTAVVDADVEVSTGVFAGTAVEELTDLSSRVDLLIVGSRAWGPVRRILLGSTAAHLMRQAHCPVLVLPRGAATGQPGEQDAGARADPSTAA
jgi:nucleotide-binding universal stress UspA family protein